MRGIMGKELEELRKLVLEFFEGDEGLADIWFATPNYQLGNVTPQAMIDYGLEAQLLRWTRGQVEENVGECPPHAV